MSKITRIRSEFSHLLSDERAIVALVATFASFGSLEPNANAIAQAMVAAVRDPNQLPGLAAALAAVECDDRPTFEFFWFGVTLVTPTSQTRIKLQLGGSEFELWIDFGPKGSTRRAEQIRTSLRAARILIYEDVLGDDGEITERRVE